MIYSMHQSTRHRTAEVPQDLERRKSAAVALCAARRKLEVAILRQSAGGVQKLENSIGPNIKDD